ncbi:phosphohistidine phosphatase SixA [Archaeoglobus sp.]|jgi:phosphohistidine phosphatase|uniref:phosphohistidine phosphatase SixA n=1 Tax=Archaeoglobus sp. TaxID=1872626 RepID=UPI0024AC605E|nr:phosphohistidine phosphatase SixA [Archaeoglobus sp.]MDI3498742.1 phosphohistidine phosphatase [Archaeoglobus sp.]
MRLYLMQHGKAKPKEVDPERNLSEEGVKEVERVAAFLEKAGIRVERIYHSGKRRAEQTAEIVAKHLGVEAKMAEGLDPLADIGIWAERLEKLDEDVMLVGHLPHLSRLANYLLSGNPDLDAVAFTFGGVVCLEREEKKWRLLWAVRPEIVV